MMKPVKLLVMLTIFVVLYLVFWPVAIHPVSWDSPVDRGYVDDFATNHELAELQLLSFDSLTGPESLALGPDGLLYFTSHEGWIVRHDAITAKSERWINSGGRPLGLLFGEGGELYVADAYRGLLVVTSDGQIKVIADSFEGEPLEYVDDLALDGDGNIYFSDASSKFGARAWGGNFAASLLDIMEHGGRGRLFVYRRDSGRLERLLDGLQFANGVAVDPNGSFVLVAETGAYRIIKYWIGGEKAGKSGVLIDNLPGFPDNIIRGQNGTFWVGLVNPRNAILDSLSDHPFLRKVVQRLPAAFRPNAQAYSHVFELSASGDVLRSLQNPGPEAFGATTGALEVGEWLYISSLNEPHLARIPLAQLPDQLSQ